MLVLNEKLSSNLELGSSRCEVARHKLDNCLQAAFCVQCSHWFLMRDKFVRLGLLDSEFFNHREFRLDRMSRAICFLLSNFNKVVSRSEILHYVWQASETMTVGNVNVLIYELRLLLINQDVEIVSIRGLGYRLERKKKKNN